MIPTLLGMVAIVLPVVGCKEQIESHYLTANAATEAGAFKRGWLPAILQPDGTDLREWHDLDSNKVRGRFALNDALLHRLQSSCKESKEEPPTNHFPSWWHIGSTVTRRPSMSFVVVTSLLRRTGQMEWDISGRMVDELLRLRIAPGMLLHNGEDVWKLTLGVAIAAFFFCIGIAHVIFPDRFIKRSSVRKGGAMLTDFNRTGFQIAGIVFAAFGGFILYLVVEAIFAK